MTTPNSTPTIENTNQHGRTVAEKHGYGTRGRLPNPEPVAPRKSSKLRQWLPWLAAGAFAPASIGAAYALTPAVPSVAVRQVFLDVDGDGRLDLLLYGEVVLNSGPLAGSGSQ